MYFSRERVLFTAGWRFRRDDAPGEASSLTYERLKPWLLATGNSLADTPLPLPPDNPDGLVPAFARIDFDDSTWRVLDLPHDWGVESPFDLNLPGETAKLPWWGVAWYRKTFDVPASDQGRRIYLEVDGAMSHASVWINGRLAGGWACGYTSFRVDLTPHITTGSRNVLSIRLDNPPDSSRWYPGGGIYRRVWLVKTSSIAIAHHGVTITTPHVGTDAARVSITVHIDRTDASRVHLRTSILDATGAYPIATETACPGDTNLASSELTVSCPAPWSPSQPYLYLARTELLSENGTQLDCVDTPFGIRTAVFDASRGFLLNGKPVPLRGVCLHHDLGPLGAAVHLDAIERQLRLLREMGCNAIRCAHNPPDSGLLDLCDQLGFFVIDEFSDTWARAKKPNGYARLFDDWHALDLRAMIRRDRNHPCVILWSIGNEVAEQDDEAGLAVSLRLAALVRAEDPSRPVTAGCDRPDAGFNGFQRTLDVFGYNYKPQLYARFLAANPGLPLYGSETASCLGSRGEYLFPVDEDQAGGRSGFQVSAYDLYAPGWAQPPDAEFRAQDALPAVAGEFVWTGFDYLGEPTPYNEDLTLLSNFHDPAERARAAAELERLGRVPVPSRSSYFGILDLAGFKKDRFFLYQSRWRPDLPLAHLLPHWTWPGREGEITPVHLYTSGDEAELFLNGRSLGRKSKSPVDHRLRWDEVRYEPGVLSVIAYRHGREWARGERRTAGPAARITLSVERPPSGAGDLVHVVAMLVDAAGLPAPRAKNQLCFRVEGPAALIATDNGDPTDLTPFYSSERRAFNGLALAILRMTNSSAGSIAGLHVSSDGLPPANVVFTQMPRQVVNLNGF